MYFTFKKNNERIKKPVNRFLQDGGSAGTRSLHTSIVIKLCQTPENGLQILPVRSLQSIDQQKMYVFNEIIVYFKDLSIFPHISVLG